jgi:hypothetical protein
MRMLTKLAVRATLEAPEVPLAESNDWVTHREMCRLEVHPATMLPDGLLDRVNNRDSAELFFWLIRAGAHWEVSQALEALEALTGSMLKWSKIEPGCEKLLRWCFKRGFYK